MIAQPEPVSVCPGICKETNSLLVLILLVLLIGYSLFVFDLHKVLVTVIILSAILLSIYFYHKKYYTYIFGTVIKRDKSI